MNLVNRLMELKEKVANAEKQNLILQGELKNMESELKKECGTIDLSVALEELEKKEKDNKVEKEKIAIKIEELEEVIL